MNHKAKLFFLFLSASIFFINGCSFLTPQSDKLAGKCPTPVKTYSAGNSIYGRAIKYTKFGSGSNAALLIASIHGDEQAGALLLNQFQNYLKKNRGLLCDNTIIIIPIVNPDGFAKKTRYNINKVDLNRNFPSDNRENNEHNGSFALSEPESYSLYKIINTYKPIKILTFHESLGCIDYDGPAEKIARQLASKCRLPVNKLGAMPDSLGSYAGLTLNTPIITIELTDEDSKKSAKQLWHDYKDMLIEAIDY